MEGKMLAAAGAGALASAAVCLWFQKSTEAEAKVESAERRRAGGAREDTPMQGADAEEGVPCDSPYLAPRRAPVSSEGDELCGVTGEFDSPEPKNASLMPSPMRNVRPKTLFGDPTETCSEVALVDDHLHRLIKQGVFTLSAPSLDLAKYVQPASIDLPVHGPAYLVKEKVLPFKKKVRELLAGLILEEKPLSGDGAVLLKGQTYLVYWGRIVLPKGSRGCLSPKSSIGRIDMMVRGVVDGCGLYDIVPGDGVARELWLEISPQSFNVRLKDSIAVTQLMVFLPWDQVPCVLSAEDPSSPPSSPGQDQRLPNADSPGGSSSPQPPPQGQSVPGVAAFD
ncbi:2'-deoxycytidine 5'-triphosphate deaminase-domain-containing protein, partial [Baffinella frigidus]